MTRIGLFSLLLLLLNTTHETQNRAVGQEPKEREKKVTIRWYGQSFYQITDSTGQRIVLDPHAIPAFGTPRVKADFVLITHLHDDHNQPEILDAFYPEKIEDAKKREGDVYRSVVLKGKSNKQEWKEISETRGPIKFRTVQTFHDANMGFTRGMNAVWVVEVDGLVICHLGDLGHELTPAQVKAIGKVDVLMVPVGGIYTINGETAKKVVEQLQPKLYVLPMHYGVPNYDDILGPDEFLEDQPKERVKKTPESNELVIPADTKAPEKPTILMLGWKKDEPPKKDEPKKP
ncbi:MAG: MBL fold metallo-hydrolase [Gemmataceae bacterium]